MNTAPKAAFGNPTGNEDERCESSHNSTRQRSGLTHQSAASDVNDYDGVPQPRSGTMLPSFSSHTPQEALAMSSNSIYENEKLQMSSSYSHNPYTSPTTKVSPATASHPAPEAIGGVTVILNYAPRHLRHRNPIFQAPAPPPPLPVASIDNPPSFTHEALSSLTALPVPQRPMCCYFKQKGFCKMGATCWYSHEGDLYTPCHYGASCKAGHATLVLMREKSDAHNQKHHIE
jgi:hypothetical protein